MQNPSNHELTVPEIYNFEHNARLSSNASLNPAALMMHYGTDTMGSRHEKA